jgi:hypothetical protein
LLSSTNTPPKKQKYAIAETNDSRTQKRFERLEKANELPSHAGGLDWELVRKTSWWGKPLDPKEFWKGRAIWLDQKAELDAQRRGRFYPPIPLNEKKFSSISEKDIESFTGGAEGSVIAYHYNDRETAFWNDFERTQPIPPDELVRKQIEVEGEILASRTSKIIRQEDVAAIQALVKSQALALNYPPEAFTDDALLSTYVLYQHQKYEGFISNGRTLEADFLLRRVAINHGLITNPPSADNVNASCGWKIAYLKRLRSRNVDQSYLAAYLEAWNLSSNSVFGAAN